MVKMTDCIASHSRISQAVQTILNALNLNRFVYLFLQEFYGQTTRFKFIEQSDPIGINLLQIHSYLSQKPKTTKRMYLPVMLTQLLMQRGDFFPLRISVWPTAICLYVLYLKFSCNQKEIQSSHYWCPLANYLWCRI